jgi:hypothetical protein
MPKASTFLKVAVRLVTCWFIFLYPFDFGNCSGDYPPVKSWRNNFFKAFVAADVSPLILKEFEPTYVGCYGQKISKKGLFRAQTGYLPHR